MTIDTVTTTVAWPRHFGLTHVPFTKAISVEDLHRRDTHNEAVARIHHCIDQRSIGVICGDVGAGKTVAVRAAAHNLDRTKHVVIYLANPAGGCRGIYVAVAAALGATPRFHKAEAINQTMGLLAAETNERHRHVTFVIDLCRPRSYPNCGWRRRVWRPGGVGWVRIIPVVVRSFCARRHRAGAGRTRRCRRFHMPG